MAISIGGIDITDAIINAEYRIGILERIIDKLLRVAPHGTFTDADIAVIRKEVIRTLQEKYPDAGIAEKNA